MKIVILGIGETGYYLAQLLSQEKHDLILIEKDAKKVQYATEHLDVQIIHGDGANALVLEPLLDEKTDFFIAATDRDEVNILATLIARNFGTQRALVRVSDPTNLIHPLLTDDPKVSVLNAEMAVAKDLTRLVGNPSADEVEFFANGKAEMMRLHVADDSGIIFKSLKDIQVPDSWLIIAATRRGEFSIVSGDFIIQPGDQLLVIGNPEKSREIESLLGLHPVKVRRVILIGYNSISAQLARVFRRRNIEVRLIEEDKHKAEVASAELHGVLVINGDGTNDEILSQAGIDQADYVLALTHDDESNVLISLLAKEKKVRRVIAMTLKPQYNPIIEKIGIDCVVNPRSAIVDEIVRSIHHQDLSGLTILEGGKGRMMEFVIQKEVRLCGTPLTRIRLPKQTLIGAIVRGEKLIIPRGNDRIQPDDHVVVFTTQTAIAEVKKIFTP
ncbi:MAG: Trk system potassium transporter TrkA [Candidatus Omnitrophica bacterium]|nr:Trk system potassium transporter TrkA [Candidatus Omnitrophota bacterium]